MQINEEERGKLPEKEFRIMIVKMIKTLENKMEKMQDSINKDLEELKSKHTKTQSQPSAGRITTSLSLAHQRKNKQTKTQHKSHPI